MRPTAIFLFLALCSQLSAQGTAAKSPTAWVPQPDTKTLWVAPQKAPKPDRGAPLTRATPAVERKGQDGARASVAPTIDSSRVYYDQPGDGSLWAMGRNFKAKFEADGMTYVPLFAANTSRSYPVRWVLRDVSIGGTSLTLTDALPNREGNRVSWSRGPVTEVYAIAPTQIEQMFELRAMPGRGDLVVRLDVQTDLTFSRGPQGFVFGADAGRVRYGQAFVRDGRGAVAEIESRYDAGTISLVVPGAFLSAARTPITIDPVITSFSATSGSSLPQGSPDIAYSALQDRYMLCWERQATAFDYDVWAELRNSDGSLVPGSGFWIDISTDNWRTPQIAYNRLADRFLVVAEVREAASTPFEIRGRTRDAAPPFSVGGPFLISDPGVAGLGKRVPDVGGDPETNGPTYWTVVWEHARNEFDIDIHYRQVNVDGTLRGSATGILDNTTAYDEKPCISKSDGAPPFGSQQWVVVWQRFYSGTDRDIYGSLLSWDGVILQPTFVVDNSSVDSTEPSVSSVTREENGTRRWLAVYEDEQTPNDHDIYGRVYQGSSLVAGDNLNRLDGNFQTRDHTRPSVDSDGCRFAVAFTETLTATDTDTMIFAFHLDSANQLQVTDPRTGLGRSFTLENRPEIASVYSGGGGFADYGAVWDDADLATPIEGAIYEGVAAGGHAQRNTGCGSLTMAVTGRPALGETLTYATFGGTPGTTAIIIGQPIPAIPLCSVAPCAIGVGNPSISVPDPLTFYVPCVGNLIGATFSVQGFSFRGGPCVSLLGLASSETIDTTVQ